MAQALDEQPTAGAVSMRYVVSKNGMYVEKYSCAAERCVLEWTNDVGKAHKFGVNSFMLSRIAGFCFGKPVMV